MDSKGRFAVAAAVGLATSSFAQDEPCAWEFFETPSIAQRNHILYDLNGLADDDVWGVGWAQNADFDTLTFAMHFDGFAWAAFPTPNPSDRRGYNTLSGVAMLAPDDVFAVGTHNPDSGGASQTLAMRFDGSDWSLINSPFIEGGSSFDEIELIGEDLWAIGLRRSHEPPPAVGSLALAARWTGASWELEPVPPLAELGGRGYNNLRAIAGVTPDDVWGVGVAQQTGSVDPFGPRTYMVHWDGGAWSLVDFDFGHPVFSALEDVVAIAHDDVYAVGWTLVDGEGTQPLIAHFDGSSWSQVDLGIFPGGPANLRAVAARSSDEVYALGTWAGDDGFPRDLILRFDGTSWERMPGAPEPEHEWFRAAETLPSGQIWAGGQRLGFRVLAERLSCTPGCGADIDGDGDADGNDFFGYLDLFAGDDDRADIDGDDDIDADDFFGYLDLFAAGC